MITRFSLLVSFCIMMLAIKAQNPGNYISIKTDGFTGDVRDIKVYQDSVLKWLYYPKTKGSSNWSYELIYNDKKELISRIKYVGGVAQSVDSVKFDSNGMRIKQVDLSDHDGVAGVEFIYDDQGRAVESKRYEGLSSKKKRKLVEWYKYSYILKINYDALKKALD